MFSSTTAEAMAYLLPHITTFVIQLMIYRQDKNEARAEEEHRREMQREREEDVNEAGTLTDGEGETAPEEAEGERAERRTGAQYERKRQLEELQQIQRDRLLARERREHQRGEGGSIGAIWEASRRIFEQRQIQAERNKMHELKRQINISEARKERKRKARKEAVKWAKIERENAEVKEALRKKKMEAKQQRESLQEQVNRERQERINAENNQVDIRNFFQTGIKLFIHLRHRQQQSSRSCTTPGCSLCTPRIQTQGHHRPTVDHQAEDQICRELIATLELPDGIDDVTTDIIGIYNESSSSPLEGAAGSSEHPNHGMELALVDLTEQLYGSVDDIVDSMMTTLRDNPSLGDAESIGALLGDSRSNTLDDATREKEEGNEYFKAQNFDEAINCYTTSINQSPTAATYANRAQSYLKLNQFTEAENDCTEALKIAPLYFKAYARRAMARHQLGRNFEGALDDVEVALSLEPNNTDMAELRAQLQAVIGKGKRRAD